MAGRPAAIRSPYSAPAAPVVSPRSRSPPCRSDPRRARTTAGVSRSQVCHESGPGSSGTSPELRRPALGAVFSPRPHLDVVFAGCGAELF
ncbi:hypothetical protein NDU88_010415 [Pleurodeles waltl]|uniref:Uncharacterized protein n=1 Tax=Pleurodeles waltl TaxID=8319 RepID=A0AAV7PYN3_PLEWA|nr:hypothetical protein NDU88_010415 [Pleurodeles waltl]